MSVAKTILNQLGGNKFLVMTGAKHLFDLGNGLQFKLPNFAGVRINAVRITLDPSDTYSVEFGRVRGSTYSKLSEHNEIYADSLVSLLERETGLATSL